MSEVMEKSGKDVKQLVEEFRSSLRDAAKGNTSSDLDAIRERIESKRERSESGQ
jgi:hypothetical protein